MQILLIVLSIAYKASLQKTKKKQMKFSKPRGTVSEVRFQNPHWPQNKDFQSATYTQKEKKEDNMGRKKWINMGG